MCRTFEIWQINILTKECNVLIFFSRHFYFLCIHEEWRRSPRHCHWDQCCSMLISPKPTWNPYILDMICIKDSILLRYLHRIFKNIQQFWDNWLTTEPGSRILSPGCGVIIHFRVYLAHCQRRLPPLYRAGSAIRGF